MTTLSRDIVREVRAGNMPESFHPFVGVNHPGVIFIAELKINGEESKSFARLEGSLGQLDALAEAKLLIQRIGYRTSQSGDSTTQYESSRSCTLTGAMFEAVDSNFTEEAPSLSGSTLTQQASPVAIQESLQHFRRDYPDPRKVCFVMMQFGKTTAHEEIERGIKETLGKYGMTAILARDKEYHEELYPNIQTYMHGCGFGVAVFERIEKENFNPNVSLEVGYMLGLKKQVMLLKDQTLAALQADLVGRLYKPFDPLHPPETIAPQLEQWMEDKGFI